MDVLTTAWQASGRPLASDPTHPGSCARCGHHAADLVPTGKVVSKVFTGYDGWREPAGAGLCPPCVWGYRTPALRAAAHLVTRHPAELRQLESAGLAALLAQALQPDRALVVPLRPGRKHLLPGAVWGRVTVDDTQLPWGEQDARRLAAMGRLRALGFGSRMLTAPAPAWTVLRRLPRNWWQQVTDDWAALDVWRARQPWFELAVRASFTPLRAAA